MNPEDCLNHQLNSSSSKFSYKFGKSERFPPKKLYHPVYEGLPIPSTICLIIIIEKHAVSVSEIGLLSQTKMFHLLPKITIFLLRLIWAKERVLGAAGTKSALAHFCVKVWRIKASLVQTITTWTQHWTKNLSHWKKGCQQISIWNRKTKSLLRIAMTCKLFSSIRMGNTPIPVFGISQLI